MADFKIRSKKFFITIINERKIDNVQFNIINILSSGSTILFNQYGKTFTNEDLGQFDLIEEDGFGIIEFYPNDNRPNDYTYSFLSLDLTQDDIGKKSLFLGDLVEVGSYTTIKTNNFSKIIEIPENYLSTKLNIQLSVDNNFQFDELNIIRKESDIISVQFGTLFTGPSINSSIIGIGTYNAYIQNDNICVDFIPALNLNSNFEFKSSFVSIANTNFSEPGKQDLKNVTLFSRKTSIPSRLNPIPVEISSHKFEYNASYHIVQCVDLTNNRSQLSEVILINSRTQAYTVEYSSIFTDGRIGTFDALTSLDTELLFIPEKNIDVEVTVYQIKFSSILELQDSLNDLNLLDLQLNSGLSRSSDGDSITEFNLTHKGVPIFERLFNGSNSGIVNLENNTIRIPGHFFVTGEKVNYTPSEFDEENKENSIGVASTDVPGIGITNLLPKEVYVVKVDSLNIKLARSAEDALKILPNTYNFTSLGVGDIHKLVSTKQNLKSLISIDNVIQSPLIYTGKNTILLEELTEDGVSVLVENKNIFSAGNIIQINDELMRVLSVLENNLNIIIVRRNILGSDRVIHPENSTIKIIKGNYNIVNNKLHFSSPPYGLTPQTKSTDPFDERDYSGLQVSSSFDGRVFLRSGIVLNDEETYEKNYLFDDITNDFNGVENEFTLTSDGESVIGIEEDNAIILINNTYQSPKGKELSNVNGSYFLTEENGDTNINFVGAALSALYDINTSSVPYGGVIMSVGSTDGYGYQPLVCAGGTALVSSSGSISNIVLQNIGSGYRPGIQPIVNIGVQTYSNGIPNIEIIGTASIVDGSISGVTIANPGSGYTFTSPPLVVFDEPIGYSNIPLIYSKDSQSGFGTQATVDIFVGQQNNVIEFNLKNLGYGYRNNDILTIDVGGQVGIPTIQTSTFKEFQLKVDKVLNSEFFGWSMGQFEVLDTLEAKFNGRNKNFQITLEGKPISISKKRGSPIEIEYVLLVFINDILQIPYKNYNFTGSVIKFKSAPRGTVDDTEKGDTCKILFYKGTKDIDVEFVDVLDSPKIGDTLTINSDSKNLVQKSRIIELISAIDTADTNKYSDIGISLNESLLRPVKWCKQRDDLFIGGNSIPKSRDYYSPTISPTTILLKDIKITDEDIFVESLKLVFDYNKENISEKNKNIIEIISNDDDILRYEQITNIVSYEGDFGDIVGITITSRPGFSSCLAFDLFIPLDSYLRNVSLNSGISTTGVSGIQTGYRLSVSGTKIGNLVSSLDIDNQIIDSGNQFLNNIYECIDYSIEQINVIGVGITEVTRVVVPVNTVSGLNLIQNDEFYGKFSWGRIYAPYRSNPKIFTLNVLTFDRQKYPIIRRKNKLRSELYLP